MKRNLIRRIGKYQSFVKGGILETFAYKWNIYSWMFGQILGIVLMCFLWVAVYSQRGSWDDPNNILNGFTCAQMITYLLTAKIVGSLVGASQAFWLVADDIYEGNIAVQLIKPINYRGRVLAASIGSSIGQFLIAFVPLYVIVIVILGLIFGWNNIFFGFQWYNVIFFLISTFLSLLILDTFDFIVAQLCFYTGAGFGLMLFKDAVVGFLSGALLPLAFFPEGFRMVLSYLPFAGMLSTPNLIMMGQYSITETLMQIGLQFIWVVILSFLAKLTFSTSCKHVVSVGG